MAIYVMRKRAYLWLLLCLYALGAWLLAACGSEHEQTQTANATRAAAYDVTSTAYADYYNQGGTVRAQTQLPQAPSPAPADQSPRLTRSVDNFNATSTALAKTPRATKTVAPVATAAVADVPQGCPATFTNPNTRDIVCTFRDSRGKNAYLYYGRGTGHGGDYGWAHIKGKHINGVWYDGGIITTYPAALGTTSDVQVLGLINKALQDPQPNASGDRFEFRYKPGGSRYTVLAVVGSDGTIITAYPES